MRKCLLLIITGQEKEKTALLMSRFSRWNLLILVLYYTTIVASSRYGGSLRSTVVDETLEDKEIFRGLLNNFYSDEHDGRDENQLLNDEKVSLCYTKNEILYA